MRFLLLAFLALFVASPAALAQAHKGRPAAAKKAAPRPAARPNWLTTIVKTPEAGYRIGNPNASLKLVEYGSRSCPTCARFAAESKPLFSSYVASGKVSYEFRDFLIHPQDIAISLLGRCVPTARYFSTLDAMFAGQPGFNARGQALTDADFKALEGMDVVPQARALSDKLGYTAFFKQRGMTEARITECLADRPALIELGKITGDAQKLGVNGTPSFFLNGRKLDNVYSWAQLEPLLK
jgi:protein-disulfide isomerase